MMKFGRRKYGNKKIENAEGSWDSEGEWHRWLFLKEAEKEGKIMNLRRQVVYELIPKQMGTKVKHLKTKDKVVEYTAEHPVTYLADFVYEKKLSEEDTVFGTKYATETIVEDFKGMRTDKYIIKRKLMRYLFNIAIREVKKPLEPI